MKKKTERKYENDTGGRSTLHHIEHYGLKLYEIPPPPFTQSLEKERKASTFRYRHCQITWGGGRHDKGASTIWYLITNSTQTIIS